MAIYSIADLEKVSGIKAHTLRIWEKRYELFKPERTETNIRFYRDEDLKKILNIALLNKLGYKISKIAEMPSEMIQEKIGRHPGINEGLDTQIESLTISVIAMDEVRFNAIIDSFSQKYGFDIAMKNLIIPFLEKLHLLLLAGSINTVQEFFVANLFKQKLYAEIDKIPTDQTKGQNKVLLYLPSGESQELSLLFLNYLLKLKKYRVVNIGQQVGLEELREFKSIHNPRLVITIITEWTDATITFDDYIKEICTLYNESTILLSGMFIAYSELSLPKNCFTFDGIQPIMDFICQKDMKKATIFSR